MVGKVWTDTEERYFWRRIVTHSSKRAGADRANIERTWEYLAGQMQGDMDKEGASRRNYTSTMLFEHYFQNVEGQRHSPHASRYVNEYLAKLGSRGPVENPRGRRTNQSRGSRARTARATKSDCPVAAASPLPSPSPSPRDIAEVLPENAGNVPSATYASPLGRPLRSILPAPVPGQPPSPLPPATRNYSGHSQAPSRVPDQNGAWGYQMGKRSGLETSSSLASCQPHAYLGDQPGSGYPAVECARSYQMSNYFAHQPSYLSTSTASQSQGGFSNGWNRPDTNNAASWNYHRAGYSTPAQTFPSAYSQFQTPLHGRNSNSNSFRGSYGPQPECALGYQSGSRPAYEVASAPNPPQAGTTAFGRHINGHSTIEDSRTAYGRSGYGYEEARQANPKSPYSSASTVSQASPPNRPSSSDTVEETLFVENEKNNEGTEDGSEEVGEDNGEAEGVADAECDVDYDDVDDADYIPGAHTSD
ncbi:hypothetical protein F4677DRAFT_445374 [Hypoxylon crocopeplum]|nr:hypothetical protein F4677DRAFT_445374 [Hypoxylon crocopeplum]